MAGTTRSRKTNVIKTSDTTNEANVVSSAADVTPLPTETGIAPEAGSVADRDVRIAKLAKPFLAGIGKAKTTLRGATTQVSEGVVKLAFARVAFGASVLPVYQGLTDEKGDFRWKASSALDHIVTAYLAGETDEKGKPYNGATVAAWLTAAEQEALLPEDHRNRFGSDAHRTFARVRKAKGDRAMLTFVKDRVRKDETSVGKVRAAYDAKYPADPKPEATPASQAASIQSDEIEAATFLRREIAKLGIEASVIMPLLYSAAHIGQRHPDEDPDAMTIAIRFLATEPKPKAKRTRKATAK